VSGGALQRAQLVPDDGSSPPLDLHYNPSSFTLRTGARWRQTPTTGSRDAAKPQFTGADPVVFTMDVLFDGVDDPARDVGQAVGRLVSWTRSTGTSRRRNTPQPPLLLLWWGGEEYGPLYLTTLVVKHTMFAASGAPLRATATVTLTEVLDAPRRTNPTSGGLSGRRRAVLDAGGSLAAVAQREYADPALWRAVAAANGIDDPGRVAAGTPLLLPSLAQARALAGVGRA
jgi:hypothetical protein